jgi:hypothetical protein
VSAIVLGVGTTLGVCWIAPGALRGLLPYAWYSDECLVERVPHTVGWSHSPTQDYVTAETPQSLGALAPHRALPSWFTPPASFATHKREDTLATGFPWRAALCRAEMALDPARGGYRTLAVRGGIETSSKSGGFGLIPLTPLWPGLIADLAAWSLAWGMILTASSRARRWLGTRHPERCRNCRYDLSGIDPSRPCPECGATPRPAHTYR